MPDLSRGKRLFFRCIRGERPDCVPEDTDWSTLEGLIREHACESLFYGWLKGMPEVMKKFPSGFLDNLLQNYRETGARNALRRELLKEVLQHLALCQVPVILHKGILFADWIYQNIAMRPMGDVDLLVPFDSLPTAEACLRENGFRQDTGGEAWHKGALSVDLHTDIINTRRWRSLQNGPGLRMGRMWERARPVDFEGFRVFALSPEDQLIALCVHLAFNHRLHGWIRFADLARLLQRWTENPDWDLLVGLAREHENSKSLFYCLKFLADKLEMAIPPEVLRALKPVKQGFLERQLLRRIWKGKPLDRFNYFLSLALIEDKKMRRRYFWNSLFARAG